MQMKLFLDCDQTLYRCEPLIHEIRERMVLFMSKVINKPADELARIRAFYLREYGTTLAGLMAHENINPQGFVDFVHNVKHERHLKRDPRVRKALIETGMPIYIASNAPRPHIIRVLEILEISDIPKAIFSIEDFGYKGKPNRNSYAHLLSVTSTSPQEAVFVDDYASNLEPARSLGMITCLVGEEEYSPKIESILELPSFLSQLGVTI